MTYSEIISAKIFSREELVRKVQRLQYFGKKVIFTNGCFDLLHLGHVDYLAKAKDCGDFLIVAVNADQSVKRLNKGDSRPIQNEHSRAMIIASLHVVDAVVIFNEETPYELISALVPDVLVKGADYRVEQIAGHDVVLQHGGEVKLVELVQGYSTSAIEKKIKEA
jgi:rfaE bifunctional protein nucleotidyltransferase chain/domain